MEWLCSLSIGLLAIACIGHALWLIGVAFIRALFGSTSQQPEETPRRFTQQNEDCPSCGTGVYRDELKCPDCGIELNSPLAHNLRRLHVAEKEVRALGNSGALDATTTQAVTRQLQRRARTIQGLPAEPRPVAPTTPYPVVRPIPNPPLIPKPEPATPVIEPVPATNRVDQEQFSPPPQAPPRHGSILAGFMEERNILWGELAGGMLIVGCSIALVVTLWNKLEAIPYFPFLLSASVMLALYGAGQYTLHHWKLTSTSRGLLVIAMLLAPLNLLLLSDPIKRGAISLPIDVAVKLAAVMLFAWIVRGGGRDMLTARPQWRWLLAFAVVGAPATQLLPTVWFASVSELPAWLALACYAGGVGAILRLRQGNDEPLEHGHGVALLQFLGLAIFALAAGWGLYVAQSADTVGQVLALALPLTLAGAVVVEVGLLILRRASDSGLKVTGTAVGLAGFVVMTGGLAAAWPDPLRVLLVSSTIGLFLTHLAFRSSLPWVHFGAIPALAFAAVVGYHGLAGEWHRPLAELHCAPASGLVLVGFALALAAAAELLVRREARSHAISYALGGTSVGLIGLFLASTNGLDYPLRATAAYAAGAVGLIAVNFRWRLRVVALGGLWLLLVGSLWVLHATCPGALAQWGFVVSLEALTFAALAIGLTGDLEKPLGLLGRAGRDVSLAAALLALALAGSAGGSAGGFPYSEWHTGTLFVLSFTGLALAGVTGLPQLAYIGSVAAALGFVHLTTYTLYWKPDTRAVLVALLGHATAVTLLAIVFRRRERLFAFPLRTTAVLATSVAAFLLLFPTASLALEWGGYAAWLGLIWLALALVWRERGFFPAFQVALSLSAVLFAMAWVHAQEWRPETVSGYFNPTALHAYMVALGFLSLTWVAVRRRLRNNIVMHELWTSWTWSAERVVLGIVVVFQFLLVAWALLPEVRAELTPHGVPYFRGAPPGLADAFGTGAWIVLGILSVTLIASFRLTTTERDTDPHLFGLLLLFLTVPIVWAGTHASALASASALRWGLGIAFVAGTGVLAARTPVRRLLEKLGFRLRATGFTRPVSLTLLAFAALLVVMLSAQVAELGLTGSTPSGPVAESVFAKMSVLTSNLVPLALVVLGLGGTALRERAPGYAFAGGLVFTATIVAGYALGVITAGGKIDDLQQLRMWLLLSSSAAIWAAGWLGSESRVTGGPLLALQSRLGLAGMAILAVLPVLLLIIRPEKPLPDSWRIVGEYGWFVLVLASGVAVWQSLRNEPSLKFHAITVAALIAGVLAACVARSWDDTGLWLSFHTLSVAWSGVGVGLIFAVRMRLKSSNWVDGITLALVILALRGGWSDPWRPWLPAGLAMVAATVIGAGAVVGRSLSRVTVSGLLFNLSAILLWLPSQLQSVDGFLMANAAGLAFAAAIWTAVALCVPTVRSQPFTDLARGVTLVLLGFGIASTLAGNRAESHWLTWGATVAVVLSMAIACWEPRALIARGGLFAAAVAAVLLGVSEFTPLAVWNVWQTPVTLAAFTLFVSLMAVLATRMTRTYFRLPERGDPWNWLLIGQGLVAVAVLGLGIRTGLTSLELSERLASPVAVLLLTVAAALLTRAAVAWSGVGRFVTLSLGVLVFATAAWALPDPTGVAPWLQRNGWLFVVLGATGILGSELGPWLSQNWRAAARSLGAWTAALACVVLCVNLMQQIPVYDPIARHTPLEPAVVLSMLAAIVGLIALALRFALTQDHDPLHMSERSRTSYVYLAEVLLVLLFTHIRFNVPELFLGAAVKYWTFAVMALAFVGVGLAEVFERRKVNVLALPLRRTGVLLPLIPLLAFWAKPPAFLTAFATGKAPGLSPFLAYLEKLPQHFDTYAWLWFLAGGLYGLVALSRNSFGWALLAALSTNAALWSLLNHNEIPFFVHPQAWVIPLALIVLISEHINREKLQPRVSNGLRYLGVVMIYIASAADMFIAGVGQSVWLPVILAVLCVLGVLAGIMLRVKAFIFLGVGFLFIDIFAMIWHAAVNLEQTWVWYASGIVLGVAILALFAVFEKRKKKHADV